MNRPAPHSRRIPYIVAGTALFALLAFLLSQTGYYSFCYLEQWDTFIYNSAYLTVLWLCPADAYNSFQAS